MSIQSSVAGKWRAMVLRPEGQQAEVTLDLEVDGAAVSGTITGPPLAIRDGRIEGVKTDGPGPEITDLRCPVFSDVLVH